MEWTTSSKEHLDPSLGGFEPLNGALDVEEVSEEDELDEVDKASPSPYRFIVGIKEREMIAKAAFKTWFRIKPGNKEIKDRWWALYYKKILPKYQLRDNHLGRQINSWIEEEMRSLEQEGVPHFQQVSMLHSQLSLEDHSEPVGRKRKKLNSAKEGTVPAYLNVELVHPAPDLIKFSKLDTIFVGGGFGVFW